MKTLLANKKEKWERGIPKDKWYYKSFQQRLALDSFLAINLEMGKYKATWPAKIMTDFIKWDNGNPQQDPTEGLQLQGPYTGYTLSLTLCKKSVLEGRIGREISHAIRKAWVTVGKSGIKMLVWDCLWQQGLKEMIS